MYSICFYLIFISCSQSCYFLICSDCFVFYFIQFRLFVLHSVKKIYCCNLLSDHSLTTLFANERSFQLRKKCFGEKTVSYCFYQCLIPDIMTEICLYCLLNILKICSYKKMKSIEQVLNSSCYLTSPSHNFILYGDDVLDKTV